MLIADSLLITGADMRSPRSFLTAWHLKKYTNKYCQLCEFEATDPRDRVPHLVDVHRIMRASALKTKDGVYQFIRWYFGKQPKKEVFANSCKRSFHIQQGGKKKEFEDLEYWEFAGFSSAPSNRQGNGWRKGLSDKERAKNE